MTDSDDNHTSTRPISVAELLAKNGTIGAPVSGRRRRRRGNSDAVTVAELTGEIPVIKVHTYGPDVDSETADADAEVHSEHEPAASDADNGVATAAQDTHAPTTEPVTTEPAESAAPATEPHDVDVDAEPADLDAEAQRPAALNEGPASQAGAEQMSPDPVSEDEVVTADDADLLALSGAQPAIKLDEHGAQAPLSPGYAELFGGQTHSVDGTDVVEHDDHAAPAETDHGGSPLVRRAWIVGQSVLAVVFGAGMFFAFDQLWRWNMIVALVLSVLVILGLVVGVRVVRKSDDLASTLTAVVVGALVTFGPLALLTSQ
jgi:hypothetical protein